MKQVVAFNLAKVTPRDAEFFVALRSEFAQQEVGFTLFSPGADEKMRAFTKPFDWTIGNLPQKYKLNDVRLRHRLDPDEKRKWCERIASLALQRPEDTPETMVETLELFANYVLSTFSPSVVLSWNTLCPHSGVLVDLARPLGIKVYLLERAFLDCTWFLEAGGLVGHSELVDRSLTELVGEDEEDCRLIGATYLDADPFHAMERYPQKQGSRFGELLARSRATGRPVLGFLPPDDLSLAFRPVDHQDRRLHLPDYASSLEAAIALADAAPHCDIIFKPHPSFRELALPERPRENLFVVDHDYREVIAQSDVVVSTGTGLVANAMAQGKPVLQMNRDQFLNKGITYEALTLDAIPRAVERALAREDLTERLDRFRIFIGYCLQHYLVSAPDADPSFRRPEDAVRDIVRENFGRPRARACLGAFGISNLSASRLDMFRALRSERESTLLVDLDHTLLFGNTTELFLESVRPPFLFVSLHWLLTWLMPWPRLAARGVAKDQMFDTLRVVLTALFSPWNLVRWRRRVKELVQQRANHTLLAALRLAGVDRVVVVTNGHPWLVRPLLRALGLGKARLICCGVLPGRSDIRRLGKFASCSRRLDEFRPGECIAISDSRDDFQMLTRVARGFLIDWRDAKKKADPLACYFPFVLTTEGKYPKARVVRRHRFQEDLPIILIAFALAGLGLPALEAVITDPAGTIPSLLSTVAGKAAALSLLFLSFNSVYEIGYWDNDFVAAAVEKSPNVSREMERFRNYPIRRGAWAWGIVCGMLGALVVAIGGFGPPLQLPVSLPSGLPGVFAVWAVVFAIWVAGLVTTRYVFNLHNSLPETARIYSFYLLHALKLLIYALAIPIALSGVILVTSQIYRHWLGYVVYRFQGRKDDVPRMQIRGFFFLVTSAIAAIATSPLAVIDLTWICGFVYFLAGPQGFRFPSRQRSAQGAQMT
jgi:phosphoserine phosphatase